MPAGDLAQAALDEVAPPPFRVRFDAAPAAWRPPALSWLEIHTDAGCYRGTWWGAFVGILRSAERAEEVFASEQGQVEGVWPGPTPPEGIAALHAVRWLTTAGRRGLIAPDLPIVLVADNAAIASKLRTGSTQGKFKEIWTELARATKGLRSDKRFNVRQIRTWDNRAHSLARQHQDATIWRVTPLGPHRLGAVLEI